MNVGVIGLPASGKTTLFNALTRSAAETGAFGSRSKEGNLGVIAVPDPRFDRLVEVYHPKKTAPAAIEFVDALGSVGTGAAKGGAQDFFAAVRNSDALVDAVRCFENDAAPHPAGSVNPTRDAISIVSELILGDMVLVERRLERLDKLMKVNRSKVSAEQSTQFELLGRIRTHLENEAPVRTMDLAPDEWQALRELQFVTAKPLVIAANIGESALGAEPDAALMMLRAYCAENDLSVIEVSAEAEMQVAQLGAEEEAEFLSAFGIAESGRDRLIRLAYERLGLISFFTVGEDEVKAWTVRRGQTAVEAAGKIHSDIARGFIRAEVVSYDHLIEDGGMSEAKTKGHWRLEGKEYVVHDGDILNIRFNVSGKSG